MQQKKVNILGVLAIFSLFLITLGVTVVTPAMATLTQHFEGYDAIWISTLPSLFLVAGTFTAGSLEKRLTYRTLAVTACIFYLVGGCAPAFFDNYMLTLVCRAVFGFGLGLLYPLGNTLVIKLYTGSKQASMLGYGTLCMNAGGIILQIMGGSLAEKGWNYTFLAHAFCLICLAMSFFLPEPEKKEPEVHTNSGKEKVHPVVWGIGVLFMVFNILTFPSMVNTSILFEMRNAGGAAAAAASLSLYTAAGCVAGLIFGKIFQYAKRWCLTLGYALCGLGALCMYAGKTNLMMTIGLMMMGFGFSVILPAFVSWAGAITPPSTIAMATSILLALMNLGGFLSALWMKFLTMAVGENVFSSLVIEIIIFLLTALFFVFYNPYKEK